MYGNSCNKMEDGFGISKHKTTKTFTGPMNSLYSVFAHITYMDLDLNWEQKKRNKKIYLNRKWQQSFCTPLVLC